MKFKSGCIVGVALILIPAVFLTGCVSQDAQRLDTLLKENQELNDQPEELKNNQSTPVPIATSVQTTTEPPVEKLKREQAEPILTSTPIPAPPVDTIQYTPVSTENSQTPAPSPKTPRPTLTPTTAPTPALTATPMPTPAPESTSVETWSFSFV